VSFLEFSLGNFLALTLGPVALLFSRQTTKELGLLLRKDSEVVW